ncbi:hypothetical protein MSATCC14277_4000 [Metamycoplasma salivarium]|nr:hypothetical protein MSATCC14277_4000 [Metamycoplasma salivarium]
MTIEGLLKELGIAFAANKIKIRPTIKKEKIKKKLNIFSILAFNFPYLFIK